jgi:hypothetical protein
VLLICRSLFLCACVPVFPRVLKSLEYFPVTILANAVVSYYPVIKKIMYSILNIHLKRLLLRISEYEIALFLKAFRVHFQRLGCAIRQN